MSNNFQNNSVQDESTPSKPTETSLCKNCFEFFGNPAHDNLCSACYKNCQKPLNVTPARPLQVQSIIAEYHITALFLSPFSRIAQAQENKVEEKIVEEKKEPEPAKQVSSSKCLKCKKKVGLLGYDCKCGSTFCKLHRLPEDHDCEFDFCSKEREKLRKANPIVTASKLVKF